MKRIIKRIKEDFESVSGALLVASKGKMPKWAIVIWYVALLPVGLALWPILKIKYWIEMRKMDKQLKQWFENREESN